jgi:hypothetical protein
MLNRQRTQLSNSTYPLKIFARLGCREPATKLRPELIAVSYEEEAGERGLKTESQNELCGGLSFRNIRPQCFTNDYASL